MPAGHPTVNLAQKMPAGHPSIQKTMPAGHPSVSPDNMKVQPKLRLIWKKPSGWTQQQGSMLKIADFRLSDKASLAECYIVVLGGNGGGFQANVKRWSRQMGIVSKKKPHIRSIRVAGVNAMMVDLRGSYRGMGMSQPHNSYRMLATQATTPYGAIFIKMIGQNQIVDKNYQKYLDFCKSIIWKKSH